MKTLNTTKDLELAHRLMYERLADFLTRNVNLDHVSVALEAGCGSGQLTIPLAKRIAKRCKIIAFDISSGPYDGALRVLGRIIQKRRLVGTVEIVKGDVRNMINIKDETVDLIISNELFCELDRRGLRRAIKEFYRILKRGRQMVHAELNPFPENKAQELMIKANSYSLETMTPRPSWFSPTADEIAGNLHKTGFSKIHVKYFETNLRLGFDLAVKQLRKWKTAPIFMARYEEDLRRYGLEYPIEHAVFCEKP